MPSPIKRARTMFPEMPNEVFDLFLSPIITNDIGWPFHSLNDTLDGTDWYRILYPFTLFGLNKLSWKRQSLFINIDILYPFSQNDIGLTILNKSKDVWASIGRDSKPSRDKLAWHEKFVLETGGLCAPVTLALTPIGFKILDGHHRISSLFVMGLTDKIPVDAWVGIPNIA